MFDNSKIVDKQAFFVYQKTDGSIEGYHLVNISLSDHHLQGISLPLKQFRTFRLDRIVQMLADENELLAVDISTTPRLSSVKPARHSPKLAEIAFTGFSKADKDRLEKQAQDAELSVKKDVTKRLAYLCCGPNAGPTKTAKARDVGALALTEQQFIALITTGELPEVGEYDLMDGSAASEPCNDIDFVRDTFSTWRTLPRRQCLLARFIDGFAAGWRFAVHEAHRPALDIKLTAISTISSDPKKPDKRVTMTRNAWTQGHAFNFIGGEMICSHITGHRGPWSEFLTMTDERVISVKFSTPAGYDTVDRIDGEFTGELRKNNASSEQGGRRQQSIPFAVNSQAYDEGTVTIAISRPNGEQLVEIERKTISQVELVTLLQHGHFTRIVTLPDGSNTIEQYNPFSHQVSHTPELIV